MARTAYATDDALTKKAWDEELFRDMVKESFFMGMAGSTSSSLLQTKEQFNKGKGDKITFGIRMKLAGAGVEEGQQLEGNVTPRFHLRTVPRIVFDFEFLIHLFLP